ncbi:MAG: type I-E CRISPR-associated protein Cas6/Cse3/CasE [Deltaproteobacteria bacterium]|nr:type I-E CRISPR-associated protein Cas6/Cse3/CasE [Deltaproteobacteria bacterium]
MSALHLVRLVLDRRELARIGARHHLGAWVDDGALLHAGLAQLFATSTARAEVPFSSFAVDDVYAESMRQPLSEFVLGYAAHSASELESRMGPARDNLLLGFDSRRVPLPAVGQRLGFRVRVCPVVRTRIAHDEATASGTPKVARESRELDAFIHQTLTVARDVPVAREAVYGDWLRSKLVAHNACEVHSVELASFRRERMRRRASGGGLGIERPNAVLEGSLTVTDAGAFASLLTRGVGRHRAFGFGMLLLRADG